MVKIRQLSEDQLAPFQELGSAMGSLPTLPVPGLYPQELKNCGVNERGTPRNELVGFVATRPSGSQIAIETVFFDKEDQQDNGDLHIVNFEEKTLSSHYRGWGTWEGHYGKQHRGSKDYLRVEKEV